MSKTITKIELQIRNRKYTIEIAPYKLDSFCKQMEELSKYYIVSIDNVLGCLGLIMTSDFSLYYEKDSNKQPYALDSIDVNKGSLSTINIIDADNNKYSLTELVHKMSILDIKKLDKTYFNNVEISKLILKNIKNEEIYKIKFV